MTNRTKQVTRKRNIFFICSNVSWIGVAAFLVIYALATIGGQTEASEVVNEASQSFISEAGKTALMSFSVTAIIGIIASFVIKDKLRTVIWMICTIMSAILFKSTGMYIVLVIWFIDEYILWNLFKYYASKVSINKEIDLREGNN